MGLFLDRNTKTCKTEQLVFCRFQTMMTFLHRELFQGLGWKILDRRHEIQKPSSDIDHGSDKCLHKFTSGHSVEFYVGSTINSVNKLNGTLSLVHKSVPILP